jgi:chorismate mutase
MIRGIRGATTVEQDTVPAIQTAVITMMDAIIAQNQLDSQAVITLFITVTDDLHAISPARVIREHYQPHWNWVPILCAQEPDIDELPDKCIRLLLQVETDTRPESITHVYQGRAIVLRPDRQGSTSVHH